MGGYFHGSGDRGHKERKKLKRGNKFSQLPALLGKCSQENLHTLSENEERIATEISELKREIQKTKAERDAAFALDTPEGDRKGIALDGKYRAMLLTLAGLEDKQAKRAVPSQLRDIRTEGFLLASS